MEGVPVIKAECFSNSLNVEAIVDGETIGHFTLAGEQGRDIIKFNGDDNKCEGAKWIKLVGLNPLLQKDLDHHRQKIGVIQFKVINCGENTAIFGDLAGIVRACQIDFRGICN